MFIFNEMIKTVLLTFKTVFGALLSLIPVYQQLDSLKEQLIAAALNIPVIVVSAVSFVLVIIRKIAKRI